MATKSYSQFQEDLQLLEFFEKNLHGYYVDVGSNDGLRDSNTALLEQYGWRGLLIEANLDLISVASKARPHSNVVHSAVLGPDKVGTTNFQKVVDGPSNLNGLSTTIDSKEFTSKISNYGGRVQTVKVPVATLDNILSANNVPHKFELLSIDVEGAELEVLSGLSLDCFQPRIILIEDNSYGADSSVKNHLQQQGYIRVHRTGVNDWYVQPQDIKFFLKERTILSLRLGKWWLKRYFQLN